MIDGLTVTIHYVKMPSKPIVICITLLSLVSLNESLRILVVFPMASKSHNILGQGVVTHLLEAGHEVVHITSFPRDKPVAKLKEVNVMAIAERSLKENADKVEFFKLKNLVGKGNFGDSLFFLFIAYDFHRQVLLEDNVVELFTDPREKFDAVILEWFFSETFAGIPPLFQCPLIWFGSTEAHWQVLKLVDELPNPAFTVDLFSNSRPPLSFWERIVELWTMVKKYVIINFIVVPFEKTIYNNVFPQLAERRGVPMPSYEEAVYNGSLLLLNSHPSIGTPFRLPQNSKYIAGYHIDEKVKPLPQDLQKIMDQAKHGVIYFSMGSNLKSKDMTPHMRDSLMEMFAKLKQTVIWKFEDDLDNVPSNIHLVKWAPQQSIFNHPNLKVFITHGGQLSTTEAIHYAVPVIGIPVMGDQHVNMQAVVNKGFGLMVSLAEDMAGELAEAIDEILANPIYKKKAQDLSTIYHDRPVPPGKELVHWVEHVVRTRGAPHLRSPALDVPFYQKLYLDLAGIVAVIVTALVLIVRRLFCKKSTKSTKSSKAENKKLKKS